MQPVTIKEARAHWSKHTRHLIDDRARAMAKMGMNWLYVDFGRAGPGFDVPCVHLGGSFVGLRIRFLRDSKGRIVSGFW